MSVTEVHEEKETLSVDVLLPGHEARITTPLFTHTRKALLEREGGRCWICARTAEEAGAPLEAHHFGIERSFATAPINWDVVRRDFPNFDWASFDEADPLKFVDNMEAQGLVLCKDHHTHPETGIHTLPWPLFVMQRYLKSGYKFTPTETIQHDPQ
jgi:hypothetical protein